MALSYFAASSNLRNACYTPTVFLFLNPISYANLISGGNKLTMMLCANADELPTHLYCFALQFVIQSTRNQQSSPNQTCSVYPTQPSAVSGDVQLQLCTNTFTKKNHQCTSTTAQEVHRASLTPTTNLAPDAAVPVSLRQERMQTAPTPMNFPN